MEIEFSAKLVCKMAFLHYDESKDAVFCHTCLIGFKGALSQAVSVYSSQ